MIVHVDTDAVEITAIVQIHEDVQSSLDYLPLLLATFGILVGMIFVLEPVLVFVRSEELADLILAEIRLVDIVALHRLLLVDVIVLVQEEVFETEQRRLCRTIGDE